MTEYRLLSYAGPGGSPRAGMLIDGMVYDLENGMGDVGDGIDPQSLISIVRAWGVAKPLLDSFSDTPLSDGKPLGGVKLQAPLQYPGCLFMGGANYHGHLMEMNNVTVDKSKTKPYFFLKTTEGTIIGPHDDVHLPPYSEKVDWEGEIVIVIGKRGKNISESEAMSHIAGYTIVNDLSARDRARREDQPFGMDWLGQKCFDTAAPCGPWITPADQIGDAQKLTLKTWVNDDLHQDSNTDDMIFDYAEQIAYLSTHVTVNPGDMIATGTPAGVGRPKGIFLKDGDVVRVEIENIGELRNKVFQD